MLDTQILKSNFKVTKNNLTPGIMSKFVYSDMGIVAAQSLLHQLGIVGVDGFGDVRNSR